MREDPITDDGSTSPAVRTGAEHAAALFTVSEKTDKRSLSEEEDLDLKSENADERKVSEEPDMINEDDIELLILITGEEDATGAFGVSKETDRQSISKDFDARWENADNRKVSEEPDVIHEDDIDLSELPEVEHHETKKEAEVETTELLRHDDVDSEEIISLETDVASADSAAREMVSSADMPACEPTEIPDVGNESGQALLTSSQVEKAAEPHFDEDTEGRTAAEPSDAETALAVEVQDSGTASPYQTLSTTSPDALGKLAEAVELRLDAVSKRQDAVSKRQIATEPSDAETAVQLEVQDSETSPVVQISSTTPPNALVRLAEADEPHLVEDTEGRMAVQPLAVDRVVGEVRNYKTRPVVQIVSTTSPDALGRLTEAAEPHLDEEDINMAVEPLVVEKVEVQNSEKTSPVMPVLTTTYPDALEKTSDDTQLVATNGLDAVVLEETPADSELNVNVDDVESRALDESLEKTSSPDFTNAESPSASEQPPGVEDGRVHLVDMESATIDDDTAAAAAAAAVAVGDDVEQMVSDEPATESVLSARDTFIEQQVNKQHCTVSLPITSFCTM